MTNEPARQELLDALAELGRVYPAWRPGQRLANVAMAAGRLEAGGVRDLEDDDAVRAVQDMLRQHEHPLNT